MSLKAGRVGVAPDQVDDFGQIKSEATSGYTKQEADAKFETQTHAASTYETKSDAVSALAEKQPINLSVPIEMLSGSMLSVEEAVHGLNDLKFNNSAIYLSAGDDLNDCRKSGVYFVGDIAVDNTPDGKRNYLLEVINTRIEGTSGYEYILQRANRIFEGLIYVRACVASENWTNWFKITGTRLD